MLKITNLNASVENKYILKNLCLELGKGEVHAIMGPNGAGKSTLGNVLSGKAGYKVSSGEIEFKYKNLLDMEPEDRAREGLFLAFQYPVEIPGVSNLTFMRESVNSIRVYNGLNELNPKEFLSLAKDCCEKAGLNTSFLKRGVNEGFSGGEKKRNELMQMMMLQPDLCIMDETDSGLDIDALKLVAEGINQMRHPNRTIVLVTHYKRLLELVEPDFVHVMSDGKIIHSGGMDLVGELEDKGYNWLTDED